MPGDRSVKRESYVGELGLTKEVRAQASIDSGRFSFSLSEKHYIDTELRTDAEEYMEAVVEATIKKSGGKATKTRTIQRGPLTGRQITVVLPNGSTVTSQIFLTGRSLYQINAVAPSALAESLFIREFLYYVHVDELALRAERKPAVFERKQKAER
jgi:hypothetical protein